MNDERRARYSTNSLYARFHEYCLSIDLTHFTTHQALVWYKGQARTTRVTYGGLHTAILQPLVHFGLIQKWGKGEWIVCLPEGDARRAERAKQMERDERDYFLLTGHEQGTLSPTEEIEYNERFGDLTETDAAIEAAKETDNEEA